MSQEKRSRLSARDIQAANAAWNRPAAAEAAPDAQAGAQALPFGFAREEPVIDRGACGRGLLCACGAAGLSHVGCVVAPTVAFMGAVGGTSLAALSVGASLALTAVGTGVWYALHGHRAGRTEKRLTLAGIAAGAAMTLGVHFSGAAGGHDHHSMEEALEWYRSRPAETQLEIRASAAALQRPLQDYIFEICGTEAAGAAAGPKISGPGLDKL